MLTNLFTFSFFYAFAVYLVAYALNTNYRCVGFNLYIQTFEYEFKKKSTKCKKKLSGRIKVRVTIDV